MILPTVVFDLARRCGPVTVLPEGFDTTNKIPAWKGTWWDRNTNATTVLTLMGAKEVVVTDVSDYEGATLLLDAKPNPMDPVSPAPAHASGPLAIGDPADF